VAADKVLVTGASGFVGSAVARAPRFAADNQQSAEEAAQCRRCSLYRDATQVVFGDGPIEATLMMVGEQPITISGSWLP
jgi:uracil-DNA glycosylase